MKRQEEFYKPITGYKAILDSGKLTNDKSGFRDWKIRMKDALVQVIRRREFLKIMEWAESTSTKVTGRESMDEIMPQAEEEASIPQHEETYRKIGEALGSLLLHLSVDKSESFLMTKRASNGWAAWSSINRWYMAASGLASDKTAAVMKPAQSKKDEDVVYDVKNG